MQAWKVAGGECYGSVSRRYDACYLCERVKVEPWKFLQKPQHLIMKDHPQRPARHPEMPAVRAIREHPCENGFRHARGDVFGRIAEGAEDQRVPEKPA